MKDKEFLCWIHERLKIVHHESPLSDYMHKLRAIIKATHDDYKTPNIGTDNDLYPKKITTKTEQEKGLRPYPLCGAAVRNLGYEISCPDCKPYEYKSFVCTHCGAVMGAAYIDRTVTGMTCLCPECYDESSGYCCSPRRCHLCGESFVPQQPGAALFDDICESCEAMVEEKIRQDCDCLLVMLWQENAGINPRSCPERTVPSGIIQCRYCKNHVMPDERQPGCLAVCRSCQAMIDDGIHWLIMFWRFRSETPPAWLNSRSCPERTVPSGLPEI